MFDRAAITLGIGPYSSVDIIFTARRYAMQGGHHVGHWPTFLVQPVSANTPS